MDSWNWQKLSTYVGKEKKKTNVCPIGLLANDDRIYTIFFFFFGMLCLNWSEAVDRKLNKTQDLADWLDSAYSYLAMVNYPYSANFMMPLPGHPIREVSWELWYNL